jgi:hypothetical protein
LASGKIDNAGDRHYVPRPVMTWLNALYDKLLLGGFEKAERESTARIVARFARGNVSVQAGRYIMDDELADLQDRGDAAAKRLQDAVLSANS